VRSVGGSVGGSGGGTSLNPEARLSIDHLYPPVSAWKATRPHAIRNRMDDVAFVARCTLRVRGCLDQRARHDVPNRFGEMYCGIVLPEENEQLRISHCDSRSRRAAGRHAALMRRKECPLVLLKFFLLLPVLQAASVPGETRPCISDQ
jgi:hypothetical protein